jgi:YVTN family beta-propeller protein
MEQVVRWLTATSKPMDFRILGPLEVSDEGRELALGGPKQRALLAILLLHRNEFISSDRLIEALWGAEPPPSAAKTLQVHISRLRRALESTGLDTGDGVVVTHGSAYMIRVAPDQLDAERFERLVETADRALTEGEPEQAAERLREALELWHDPPLADFSYESFAQGEIVRLEELHLTAIEERIDAELALGRHAQAIGELEVLVADHPHRERLRAQLMLALYRAGRQAEALEEYGKARRALVDELGLEPGRELEELQRAILAHDRALDRPSPHGAPGRPDARVREEPRRLAVIVGLALAALGVVAAVLLLTRGEADHGAAPLTDDSHAVALIDPQSNKVTDVASVGARPGALAFDRDTGALWVANADDKTVTHIDAKRLRVGRTIAVGDVPAGLAAGDGALWVASGNATDEFASVRKIDARFDTRRRTVRVASSAGGAADVALGRGGLWVAPSFGLLTRVDPRTGVVRPPAIDPKHSSTAIAVDARAVWVADADSNTVTRVDPQSGLSTATPVGNGPTGIATGAGGVWVTLKLDDSVALIDPDTGVVRTTIPVGRAPTGVAVGANSVWVANSGDGSVSRIDPRTNREAARITVGASPQDVAVAGRRVWVSARPRPPGFGAGGTARLESLGDVASMDPALAVDPLSGQLMYATAAKLLNYPDASGPRGSRLEPEVAESLPTRSRDGKAYTFTIRKGFRFSPPSNEPVTARAFKYAIERSLSPRVHGYAADFIGDVVGANAYTAGRARHVSGVTVAGNKLSIRLIRPAADFPTRISLPPFAAVPTNTPIDPEGVRMVPSAGPYYVASFAPGEGVVLKRNPNYRGSRPHRLRELRLRVGVTAAKATAHVAAGTADYAVDGVTPQNAARLAARYGRGSLAAKAGRQQYFVNPTLAIDHLTFNTSRPLFASARLRRAVNYAIDRRALARQGGILKPLPTTPTDQYLPPGVPGFRDARIYPLTPNLEKARRLAGRRRHRAVLYALDGAPSTHLAEIVKRNLKPIGIDVQIRPLGDMFERLARKGEPYDIVLESWIGDYPDPADFMMLFGGKSIHPTPDFNDGHFDKPAYNRRLVAVNRLSGPARYSAYGRLERDLARSEAPWAALGVNTSADFLSARMGCRVYQPTIGIDLAALCLRR